MIMLDGVRGGDRIGRSRWQVAWVRGGCWSDVAAHADVDAEVGLTPMRGDSWLGNGRVICALSEGLVSCLWTPIIV